jgi:hypothetical protein
MAGAGVYWDGAEGVLEELAEAAGVPVLMNGLGRGTLRASHLLAFSRARSLALKKADLVVAAGVPLDVTIEVLTKIVRHTDAVARTFTQLFLDHVLRPFQERGAPPEEWPQVRESLERLRPVAGQAVTAAFAIQMTAAAEETYGRVLGGEGFESGRSARGRRDERPARSDRPRRPSGRRRRGAGA